MSSAVNLPNHTFTGGLALQAVNQYCAFSFVRNWQLPLNQRKWENDRRKYFMIYLQGRMLPTQSNNLESIPYNICVLKHLIHTEGLEKQYIYF